MTAPIVGSVFPGTFSRIAASDSPPGSAGEAGVCAGRPRTIEFGIREAG
jgi:hypothetical protein